MAKLGKFLTYWLPALAWMLLIFTASADTHSYQHSSTLFVPLLHWLFPGMDMKHIEIIHHIFRKCGHLTEYAVLALLLWRAIHKPRRNDPRPWHWEEAGLVLALVFFYAATDEFHQVFVPGRTAKVSDVFIDTSGGAIGLLLLWVSRHIFKRR